MARSFKPSLQSFRVTAGQTITPYSFVQFTASSPAKDPTVEPCTSGRPIGIAQNKSNAVGSNNDTVEVALPGGGALLTLGGSVTVGQAIKATTAGAGIVTASAGDYAGAVAMEGGSSADVIGVHVTSGQKYSADAV